MEINFGYFAQWSHMDDDGGMLTFWDAHAWWVPNAFGFEVTLIGFGLALRVSL